MDIEGLGISRPPLLERGLIKQVLTCTRSKRTTWWYSTASRDELANLLAAIEASKPTLFSPS